MDPGLLQAGSSPIVDVVYRATAPRNRLLAQVVERVWVCRIEEAHGEEMLMPTGGSQLVLGLDPAAPVAVIQGPTTRSATVDSSPQRLAAGVSLHPGGLVALTGESASEFVDRQVPVDEVLDLDVAGLVESVRAEMHATLTAVALEHALERHIRAVDRATPMRIRRAAAHLGVGARVAEVCEAFGASRSGFVASFRSETGLSPKLFSRLERFRSAVGCVRERQAPRLAEVAVMSGYADQAHMTREFSELCGWSPGQLHRDGSEAPSHIKA